MVEEKELKCPDSNKLRQFAVGLTRSEFDEVGDGSGKLSIKSLLKGNQSLALKNSAAGFTNYLVFRIASGNPREPSLPKWN